MPTYGELVARCLKVYGYTDEHATAAVNRYPGFLLKQEAAQYTPEETALAIARHENPD